LTYQSDLAYERAAKERERVRLRNAYFSLLSDRQPNEPDAVLGLVEMYLYFVNRDSRQRRKRAKETRAD
jgi:hypothetical protein